MRITIRLMILAAVLCWASLAAGDTVVLTSGQRIEGKIVFMDNQEVILQTSGTAQTQHFSRADVAQIVFDQPAGTQPARPAGGQEQPPQKPVAIPWPANFPNPRQARDPAAPVTAKEVDDAIQRAKDWLKKAQQPDGTWEAGSNANDRQAGALTALATYALLASGESPSEETLQRAIAFLLDCKSDGTYAVGLRAQIYPFLPRPYKPEVKAAIQRDGDLLLKGAHTVGEFRGPQSGAFYTYWCKTTPTPAYDHSNSQYGVLGIWACVQADYEVPSVFWTQVESGWQTHQYPDGGWAYAEIGGGIAVKKAEAPAPAAAPQLQPPPNLSPAMQQRWLAMQQRSQAIRQQQPRAMQQEVPGHGIGGETVSMTAAGLATLFVTQQYLHGNDGIDCRGNMDSPSIEAGLNWMAKYIDAFTTSGMDPYYTLYGIERVGVASGRKYFGDKDWCQEGAKYLLGRQEPNGSWGPVQNTCWALLFLVRGHAPVVMNKLQYEIDAHGDKPIDAHWDQRPRDANNLVNWMTAQLEAPWLNWQVVNLSVSAESLHDAPILYLAGNQSLDFTDEQVGKLRQFVQEGGLILANADCGSPTFNKSLVKLCHTLFPDYEFRELPADSPIYVNEQFHRDKWKTPMRIDALSNGVRELVIVMSSSDPSRFWQTQAYGGHEAMFEFPDDVYVYCVDHGVNGAMRSKEDTYIVTVDSKVPTAATLKIARLQFAGNWNPEPAAWNRLNAILHNAYGLDLDVQNINLGQGSLNNSFAIADLTGTFKFTLTDAQRTEIRNYVQGGGALIIDAAGGDGAFALAAQNELAAIFPDAKLDADPLPLTDPTYARGPRLDKVEYRQWAKKILNNLDTPRIRALKINGRSAVFFSTEDLTCGLLGMQIDGIYGYDPASATALMEKLVLFVAPQLHEVAAQAPPQLENIPRVNAPRGNRARQRLAPNNLRQPIEPPVSPPPAQAPATPQPAPASQKFTLRINLDPAQVWTFDRTIQIDYTEQIGEGNLSRSGKSSINPQITGECDVLAVQNGLPTQTKNTAQVQQNRTTVEDGWLTAKPTLPFLGQGDWICRDFTGQLNPQTSAAIQTNLVPFISLYPNQEVAVGDTWQGDAQAVAKQFNLQLPGDQGNVMMKLLSVEQANGRPLAEVQIEAKILAHSLLERAQVNPPQAGAPAWQWTVADTLTVATQISLKGTSLIDLPTGIPLRTDLKGTISVDGKDPGPGQVRIKATGTIDLSSTASLSINGKPVTVVPGAKPAPALAPAPVPQQPPAAAPPPATPTAVAPPSPPPPVVRDSAAPPASQPNADPSEAKAKAILDLAADYRKAGQKELAMEKYQQVIDHYPHTQSAQKARQRLDEMSP